MSPNKNPMPEADPTSRIKSFEEVAKGYTAEAAMDEARRCLDCKAKPCVRGCPVNVPIPEFIHQVAEGNFDEAYKIITTTNNLPAVCGRVCPQESQCEMLCVRGKKGEAVAIGRLERFVADYHARHGHADHTSLPERPQPKKQKVAVVGSGPASLSCAGVLARNGYGVTVFESLHKPGGVLVYGIPEFRLPQSVVEFEIKKLERFGVKIVTNVMIGRTITIDELLDGEFQAVFIGTGAGLPQFMGIPGENLLGVYSANEYLTRINLMKAHLPQYDTPIRRHRRIAVVGGGNVAMDAARCARRLGSEVYVVYRRGMDELPARAEEVHHALEEGVEFKLQINPIRILGDKNGVVTGLECLEMELGELDESCRRCPVEKPGSNFKLYVDAVILAIGTSPNPVIADVTDGLKTTQKGGILADDCMACSREGVFAGGDAVTGAATVILAMGAGKTAANSIMEYLQQRE